MAITSKFSNKKFPKTTSSLQKAARYWRIACHIAGLGSLTIRSYVYYCSVYAPHTMATKWMVCGLVLNFLSVLSLEFAMRKDREHKRRLEQGPCLECGYDLRASKDQCPECETVIQAR
jgi:hypothetical protein